MWMRRSEGEEEQTGEDAWTEEWNTGPNRTSGAGDSEGTQRGREMGKLAPHVTPIAPLMDLRTAMEHEAIPLHT